MIDFTGAEIETLIESLEYSKDRVRNAAGTPESVRRENLVRLDSVQSKLRTLRQANLSDEKQSK
jgi:hypothetical protein